jgi:hypothetical protein
MYTSFLRNAVNFDIIIPQTTIQVRNWRFDKPRCSIFRGLCICDTELPDWIYRNFVLSVHNKTICNLDFCVNGNVRDLSILLRGKGSPKFCCVCIPWENINGFPLR